MSWLFASGSNSAATTDQVNMALPTHVWFLSTTKLKEPKDKNEFQIDVTKVSTGQDLNDGPFFDMPVGLRDISLHPLVKKATNLTKIVDNGARNERLFTNKPDQRRLLTPLESLSE